jgi:hypothetical protein
LNETSACARISGSEYNYMYVYDIWDTMWQSRVYITLK